MPQTLTLAVQLARFNKEKGRAEAHP